MIYVIAFLAGFLISYRHASKYQPVKIKKSCKNHMWSKNESGIICLTCNKEVRNVGSKY